MSLSSYEAYKLFLAVKMHFTQPNYDYFRYNGKVNANLDSFNRRKDKYHFAKLAKLKDATGYLVAQYTAGNFNGWAGDLFTEEAERTYMQYLSRQQSITYNFQTDMEKLEEGFISKFKVKDGQHPEALVMFRRGNISIETFTILNNHLNFFQLWDIRIDDTVLWPSIRERCLKYRPFLHYDKAKIKSILRPLIS
jgi:hypothetical protein